jgi:hypothetical protein
VVFDDDGAGELTLKPTAAQVALWERFKQVAKRADLEIRANKLRAVNLVLGVQFAARKQIPLNFDVTGLLEQMKRVDAKNERLKNVIMAVELEELGLRFVNNDIDIMAHPGTNPDVVAKYQLSGWPIIVAGIVVATVVIGWLAALRQQNAELESKLSASIDDVDALLCGDPGSDTCKEWNQIKAQNKYDERENMIDTLGKAAENFPDTVKKIASIGLTVIIPLAIIYLAAAMDRR